MLAHEFLWGLWEQKYKEGNPQPRLVTEGEARHVLESLEDVPDGLEPWELAAFWNDRILSIYDEVEDTESERVLPRVQFLDAEQIAYIIKEASTWGNVDDLVEYVLDNYIEDVWDEETDPYAVEKRQDAILAWCEEILG